MGLGSVASWFIGGALTDTLDLLDFDDDFGAIDVLYVNVFSILM